MKFSTIALFFVALLTIELTVHAAKVASGSGSKSSSGKRMCGIRLLKFVQSVCGGECSADATDFLTLACSQPFTREELIEQCCPERVLSQDDF